MPKVKRNPFRLLVMPKMQFTLVLYFTLLTLVKDIFLFMNLKETKTQLLSYTASQLSEAGAANVNKVITVLLDSSQDKLFKLGGSFTIFFYLLGGIILTHRIAGPLLQFKSKLTESMRDKNPKPLNLREGDFFHDLADVYNDFLKVKLNLDRKAAVAEQKEEVTEEASEETES